MVFPSRSSRRAVVALGSLVAAGALVGAVVAVAAPPAYTATSTVFVGASGSRIELDEATSVEQEVRTSYADVARTSLVLDPVIARLHLRTTASDLARRVAVTQPGGRAVLQVAVTDASASRSARIANAVQDRLVAVAPSLTPTGSGTAAVTLVPVERAKAPEVRSASRALLLVLGGALAGVALWGFVALIVLIVRMPKPPAGRPAPSML